MKKNSRARALASVLLCVMVSSWAAATEKRKLLNRSIYMPVEFRLCPHLGSAIFYENDEPTSTMPAERLYQFTYYPDLDVVLPEQVPVRVEGAYNDDDTPFVAKLAVTVDGVHSAHRFRSANTAEQIQNKLHKIDIRLEPQTLTLACPRFCKKRSHAVSTKP